MKRSAKVCWIGFVFSTIVIAAVAGLVIYFTAFKKSGDGTSAVDPIGGSSESGNANDPAAGGSDGTSLVDHLSHSVPGFEYEAIDFDGNGKEKVQLDGSRSHTHYVDPGPPMVVGKLVEMTWFNNDTREKLSSDAAPLIEFPVGTTIVGLTVVDNYRDMHTDYATVTVEKPIMDGAYCYYYSPSSSGITISDTLNDGERPSFSAATAAIAFTDDSKFPASRRGQEFQMRCVFQVSGGSSKEFSVDHFGPVRLLVGDDVVLESSSSDEDSTSGSIDLPSGTHTVHLLYSRSSSAAGKLELTAGGEGLQYDLSRVLPILSSIDPVSSTLEGGGQAKILGIGLQNGVKINFGSKSLTPDEELSAENEAFVTVPSSSSEGVVSVTASNKAGTSNELQFQYSSSGEQPIKFSEGKVMNGGNAADLPLITGIQYGPDHRYYLSAMNNKVLSFAAAFSMQMSDFCASQSLGQYKSILGIAFNPADTEVKAYVSASILDWKREERLSTPDAWANGEILVVKKDYNGHCLDRLKDPIITGLPVSNHDHGVNGLVFDNDGKLHIQVGGFTNAGLNDDSSRLGGIDENPLSGASLVADVTKSGFNGRITYSSNNPGIAEQTGGDVRVYSPGWRNSFGITYHSNGFLYATDNGASVNFGDKSVTCNTGEVLAGKSLADELGKVIQDKYAGHPNRNRGRKDSRQCKFKGADEPSSGSYEGPIATFESSTDGVMEYTANTFGGRLKGDILCSKYSTEKSPGKVFRVQLDDAGNRKSGPDELFGSSGLSISMSPWGHIMMPRVYKREIMVLTPVVKKGIVSIFTAVMPFRGAFGGGNEVIVTGENFGTGAVAVFGSKRCTDATAVSADRRSFRCKVPPGSPGQGVAVGIEFSDGTPPISPGSGVDYKYMNV